MLRLDENFDVSKNVSKNFEYEFPVLLVVVAIIKNEGNILRNGLYHFLVGIENIYLYINGSDDNTKKGCLNLYKNRKYGLYTYFQELVCTFGHIMMQNEKIMDTYPKALDLVVNWRMFGLSGHTQRLGGLETFCDVLTQMKIGVVA